MMVRLLQALHWLLSLLEWTLVLRAVLSWFQVTPVMAQLYRITVTFTEPVVAPVRKLLMRYYPAAQAPLDFSLLGAMLLLELIRILL